MQEAVALHGTPISHSLSGLVSTSFSELLHGEIE